METLSSNWAQELLRKSSARIAESKMAIGGDWKSEDESPSLNDQGLMVVAIDGYGYVFRGVIERDTEDNELPPMFLVDYGGGKLSFVNVAAWQFIDINATCSGRL